jgi:hypothetical protein
MAEIPSIALNSSFNSESRRCSLIAGISTYTKVDFCWAWLIPERDRNRNSVNSILFIIQLNLMMQVAPKFQVLKENLIEKVKIGIEPDAKGENLRLKTKML